MKIPACEGCGALWETHGTGLMLHHRANCSVVTEWLADLTARAAAPGAVAVKGMTW